MSDLKPHSVKNTVNAARAVLKSVWFRLAVLYVTIFGASVGLILVLVLYFGQAVLEDEIRSRIQAEVRYLTLEYEEDGLEELLEETEELIEKGGPERRLQYVIRNPEGEVIFDEFDIAASQVGWQVLEPEAQAAPLQPFLFYFKEFDNGYMLGVGSELTALADFRAAIYRSIGLTLVVSLSLSAFAGFIFGGYVSLKLKRIIAATQSVAKGKLDTRLNTQSGGYEFELLSVELNRMFQKVEDLLNSLKQVSSGLAHDLRTPLTVIKNRFKEIRMAPEADSALKHTAALAEKDIDEILRHFESVLLITELDSGELTASFEPVDLVSLIESLLESYAPLFEDAGVALDLNLDRNIVIRGNLSLLQRLVVNLLDNVLSHAQVPCSLRIALLREGSHVALNISNAAASPSGQGERSLHPGRRGMGLRIAKAIANLHEGSLRTELDTGYFHCHVKFRKQRRELNTRPNRA